MEFGVLFYFDSRFAGNATAKYLGSDVRAGVAVRGSFFVSNVDGLDASGGISVPAEIKTLRPSTCVGT